MLNKKIKIFGYSNLLNPDLYNNLGCDILSVTPCNLSGFLRVFNTYDKDKDLTLLNIDKSDSDKCVFGIAIEIYQKELYRFVDLECGNELIMADFENESGGMIRAMFFRHEHFEADDFNFENVIQKQYLESILFWANLYGENFFLNFKKTTYIGNKTLFELGY